VNELEADAICFSNLKGSNNKDLLMTAEALRFKKGLPGYRTNVKVGQFYGVSRETVREFLALLELPKHILPLIEERAIGLDIGSRLARVYREYPSVLDALSEAVTNLTAMDARDVIEFVLKNPGVSVEESKQRILDAKTLVVEDFYVMVGFTKVDFGRIEEEAKKRHLSTGELVASVMGDWLAGADNVASR